MIKKGSTSRFYRSGLILLLLIFLGASASQSLPIIASYGKGILTNLHRPAIWRSAKFARSDNFADYLIFLQEKIPQAAVVILPPDQAVMWTLSDTPSMQYFLQSREIINCSTVQCGAEYLGRKDVYILVSGLDRFPGSEIRQQMDRVEMFNDTWGVYGDGFVRETQNSLTLSPWRYWPGTVLAPALYLIVFLMVSLLLVRWMLPELSAWMSLAVGYGIFQGLQSLLAYCFLLIFPDGDLAVFGVVYLTGMVTAAGLGLLFQKIPAAEALSLFRWGSSLDSWLLLILGAAGLTMLVGLGSGYHYGDGIVLWAAKGLGIAADGLSGVTVWGTNTTIYPLHIPLSIAVYERMFGHWLPFSKLIFPLYYSSLLVVIYEAFKETAHRATLGLGVLAFGFLPLLTLHGRIGYANLPLTFFLVAGLVLLAGGWAGKQKHRSAWYRAAGGFSFIVAGWTRPEGLWLVAAVVILLGGSLIWNKEPWISWKEYLIWILLPVLGFALFWYTSRSGFYTGIESRTSDLRRVITQWLKGNFQGNDFLVLLQFLSRQLISFQIWGLVGAGLVLAAGQSILARPGGLFPRRILLGSGLLSVLVVMGVYYVFAYDLKHDMSWWLTSGFNRQVMPGMTLLWVYFLGRLSQK